MAYAEVSDIEARWRSLSDDEKSRAGVLIEDASAMLAALVDVDANDQQQAELLNTVCCNMVIRAMAQSNMDTFGVSQSAITAGPYTQSFSYSNPSGDMYLTKLEKKLLKVSIGYIGSIRPMMAGDHVD